MRGTPSLDRPQLLFQWIIPAYAGNTHVVRSGLRFSRDHPRVCGEHSPCRREATHGRGSSPRMRGTRRLTLRRFFRKRIIPAYAGNTYPSNGCTGLEGDHPRVCGEHGGVNNYNNPTSGSSPRMRGTPYYITCLEPGRGIIPAYAGNTVFVFFFVTAPGDHPRVCGEHLRFSRSTSPYTGSSPRMRGTLRHRKLAYSRHGIIPAYAGNTAKYLYTACRDRDHPRVCGEHLTLPVTRIRARGSSPRMRGTQLEALGRAGLRGIIPAYAGNTCASCRYTCSPRDHPRVCGEHKRDYIVRERRAGSSPRMRGTLQVAPNAATYEGIIPAYAGNTMAYRRSRRAPWDHPRVCGEHVRGQFDGFAVQGSSPRMRGTH